MAQTHTMENAYGTEENSRDEDHVYADISPLVVVEFVME